MAYPPSTLTHAGLCFTHSDVFFCIEHVNSETHALDQTSGRGCQPNLGVPSGDVIMERLHVEATPAVIEMLNRDTKQTRANCPALWID